MTWNLIRLSDVAPTPWRNGGGITRELTAWPEGRDWTWRISVAEVAADGPFSHLPGVQRFFAVLGGAGVRLAVNGRVHEITATSAPFEFDGAATVDCQLLAGPTQDLNLMVQRGRASGAMTRFAGTRTWVSTAAGVVAVYALAAAAVREHANASFVDLPPQTLAWKRVPAGTSLEIVTSAAICMEIALRD
jgi:environmental stress-induced protein Ves